MDVGVVYDFLDKWDVVVGPVGAVGMYVGLLYYCAKAGVEKGVSFSSSKKDLGWIVCDCDDS